MWTVMVSREASETSGGFLIGKVWNQGAQDVFHILTGEHSVRKGQGTTQQCMAQDMAHHGPAL